MEESKEIDDKNLLTGDDVSDSDIDSVGTENEVVDDDTDNESNIDMNEDDIEDEDEDEVGADEEEMGIATELKKTPITPVEKKTETLSDMLKYDDLSIQQQSEDIEVDSTDDEDDEYLQKLNNLEKESYIMSYHPEAIKHNFDEVIKYSKVSRNSMGNIVDPYHKTLDKLTKYEEAKVLGQRAKQLDHGAKSFVNIDPSVVDGYLIAVEELKQKKLPFIIRRPIPNGGFEYWPISELEINTQ